MEQIFFALIVLGLFIHRVAFHVPKEIKKLEENVDGLKLQLREIQMKLDDIYEKLENR